jgi:hypothetical protein
VGLGLLGACSGDDDDGGSTTTADLEGRPGSETGEDGGGDEREPTGDGVVDPVVEAFCAEVDQYVELIGQMDEDPLAIDPDELEQGSQELRDASDAVNEAAEGLDQEDAAGTQQCTQRLSEAGGVLAPQP